MAAVDDASALLPSCTHPPIRSVAVDTAAVRLSTRAEKPRTTVPLGHVTVADHDPKFVAPDTGRSACGIRGTRCAHGVTDAVHKICERMNTSLALACLFQVINLALGCSPTKSRPLEPAAHGCQALALTRTRGLAE